MKTLVIAVALTVAVAGCWTLLQKDFVQVYQAETEEVIIDNTPEWAMDPDAVKAAEDVIRRKELEAELNVLNVEIEDRQQRVVEIEKELDLY